jgi:hypothetical protein
MTASLALALSLAASPVSAEEAALPEAVLDPTGEAAPRPFNRVETEMQETFWGSVLPLNMPPMVHPSEAREMRGDDEVLGLMVKGEPRAYPWWVMVKHHVANDEVEGQPIVVALCEVCSGAAAFSPVVKGRPLVFAVCGADHGTFVMCDWQTHSRWRPFEGLAFEGPLAGTQLKRFELEQTSWAEWKALHPATWVVQSSAEVRARPHGSHARLGAPGMPPVFADTIRHRDGRLADNALVFGVVGKERAAKAYTLGALSRAGGVLEDTVGSDPVVVVHAGKTRAAAFRRTLRGRVLELARIPAAGPGDRLRMKAADGTIFDEWGRAISGPMAGASLELADGWLTEWYEWASGFPKTGLAK